jgi:hypothetical protein
MSTPEENIKRYLRQPTPTIPLNLSKDSDR